MIVSPENKKELITNLKESCSKTFLLAGGTDLIIKLQNSELTKFNLIDITKIKEFRFIQEDEYYLKIGALTTMADILNSKIIHRRYKALYYAAYHLGSTIIRNRATIGGNICHASQSADCNLVLFAYDAKVKILNSKDEVRIINIDDFIVGREKTILKSDEIVTEILIPKLEGLSNFVKVGSRRAVTISKLSCAINTKINNGILSNVKFYLGAVGIKPVEAMSLEEYLREKNLLELDLEKLQKLSYYEIQKAIPSRSSRFYKRIAVQGLVEDLIMKLRQDYEGI